jgi:hypothetical protein
MNTTSTIHVRLLSEDVQGAWRPIQAVHVEGDVYVIPAQPYDREDERWEFEPGDRVVCRSLQGSPGPFLAAVQKAN